MIDKKTRKILKSIKNRKINKKYEIIKITFKYFNSFNYINFDFYSRIYNFIKHNIQKLSLIFNNFILFLISIYIKNLILKYKNINIFLIFRKKYNYEIQLSNYINNLYYLQKYSKNSSISIIKNMCIDTTRSRGVLSFYKLSRIKLKEYATMGLIPGIRKSS